MRNCREMGRLGMCRLGLDRELTLSQNTEPILLGRLDRSTPTPLWGLAAWEKGLVPWLGAFLRVRQIHRANPGLRRGDFGRSP